MFNFGPEAKPAVKTSNIEVGRPRIGATANNKWEEKERLAKIIFLEFLQNESNLFEKLANTNPELYTYVEKISIGWGNIIQTTGAKLFGHGFRTASAEDAADGGSLTSTAQELRSNLSIVHFFEPTINPADVETQKLFLQKELIKFAYVNADNFNMADRANIRALILKPDWILMAKDLPSPEGF